MSKFKKDSDNGGIGFVGLLTIVFITLKLIDVINWSWWWVLSPIWVPFTVIFVGVIFLICLEAYYKSKNDYH